MASAVSVSLREKGVDLNNKDGYACTSWHRVSLREKGVDLNTKLQEQTNICVVSLREKGVDLNPSDMGQSNIPGSLPS